MKRLDISDQTAVSMPMKNLIAIVVAVAVGVWAYFGIVERINKLETQSVLIQKDMNAEDERLHSEVTKNTEYKTPWLNAYEVNGQLKEIIVLTSSTSASRPKLNSRCIWGKQVLRK